MSRLIELDLPMPYVRRHVTGFFAKIRKPSGMQYILLRLIKFGSEANGRFTVSDLMDMIGLPEDMTDFVISQLNDLQNLKMISVTNRMRITQNISLKSLSLTESGEDIFEKGRISVESRPINIPILYKPGLVRLFHFDDEPETVSGKNYEYKSPNIKRIETFLRTYPDKYGIEEEDMIYDLDFKQERAHSYIEKVRLEFDEEVGEFVFTNRSYANTDFLKVNYSGDEIIKAIPEGPFELRPELGFEVKRWGDAPENTQYTSQLPSDFEPRIKMLFNGPALAKVSDSIRSMTIQEGMASDMTYFVSQNQAYAVWFSRADAGVSGFEGTKNVKLVLSHRLTIAEMEEFVSLVISKTRYNFIDDLDLLNELSVLRNDKTLFPRLVKAQLTKPDPELIKKTVSQITRFDEAFWWGELSGMLESVLCEWAADIDLVQMKECIESLGRRGIRLNGGSLVPIMLRTYDPVTTLDVALHNGLSVTCLNGDAAMADSIVRTALDGREQSFESSEMRSLTAVRDGLARLKDMTGIHDCSNYDIVTPSFDEASIKELSSTFNSLQSNLEKLSSFLDPSIIRSIGEIRTFTDLFECYVNAHKSKKQYRTRADYVNETNPYLFYLRMTDKLKFELTRLTDEEYGHDIVPSVLKKIPSIPKELEHPISKFLKASLSGTHTRIDEQIPYEQRKEWASAIFQLSTLQRN